MFDTADHDGVPKLDRIDYTDHAVVLMERECVRPVRPALEEIQHHLGGAPFANWTEQARRFATAETLEPKDRKAYLGATYASTPRGEGGAGVPEVQN